MTADIFIELATKKGRFNLQIWQMDSAKGSIGDFFTLRKPPPQNECIIEWSGGIHGILRKPWLPKGILS